MHILMMAQHYAPEDVSGARLAADLATGLVQRGHQVTFITAAPSYPKGQVFPGYRNTLYQSEMLSGVRVVRTWSYITSRKSFWPRIFNVGSFSAGAFGAGLKAGRPDVIFSYSPPLPLGLSAWALSRLRGVPWALRVEDIYPDAAVAAGVLQSRPAICFLFALEKLIYKKADVISLPSQGFCDNLLAKGVLSSKLSIIPMWADPDEIRPLPKENAFRQRYHLQDKFLFLYAGNMGYTSALEEVILAADLLRDRPDIRFSLVGEGVYKDRLQQLTADLRLENVLFLPYQPRADLAELMSAADVSLVSLNPGASQFSMPNKVFSIMSSGRPVLAITPLDSELARLIFDTGCGLVVPPGGAQQLADTIREMTGDPVGNTEMGRRGRERMMKEFSRTPCVEDFDVLLAELVR